MIFNTVSSTTSFMLINISLLLLTMIRSSFRSLDSTIPLHFSLAYLPHYVLTCSLLPTLSTVSLISSPAHTTLPPSSSPSDPQTPFLFQSLFPHSTCLLSPELAYLTGLVHVPVALSTYHRVQANPLRVAYRERISCFRGSLSEQSHNWVLARVLRPDALPDVNHSCKRWA